MLCFNYSELDIYQAKLSLLHIRLLDKVIGLIH
jgi:hypothetical protein